MLHATLSFLAVSDGSCKLVCRFYVFTACQVWFHPEAVKSIGKINMLLSDLSFTATSTFLFSYKFDCTLTLTKTSTLLNLVPHVSLSFFFICEKLRDRERTQRTQEQQMGRLLYIFFLYGRKKI